MSKISRRHFVKQSGILTLAGVLSWRGCTRHSLDVVIKNAMIYDGSGNAPYKADIGIQGNRIAAVGSLENHTGKTIDAGGQAVSPGFIDVHTHTDISLLVNPKGESKIRQGITTEIGGNCGDSPFPLQPEHSESIKSEIEQRYQIQVDWTDTDGFLSRIEQNGTAFNYVTLLGHGDLRRTVIGMDNRPPGSGELSEMQNLLHESMDQGAFGMSTGLEYQPSSFAQKDELIALCQVVAERGGIYATHMRNEDVTVEKALAEAIDIARKTNANLQISHLKASQQRNWHKLTGLLESIALANEEGLSVHADRYPYRAYATTLKLMFPDWSREGSADDFVSRLQNKTQWNKIRHHLKDRVTAMGSWDSVLVTRVHTAANRSFQGKTILQISNEIGQDPYAFVRQLMIQEKGNVSMCGFGMSEENTEKVLAFPLTMLGSDGTAVAPYGLLGKDNPHPRYYGSFPRYLGYYVRERGIISLPEAIHRITQLPAEKFSIKNRGLISPGYYADLVIFDPRTIIDRATFTDPHQYPKGIDKVIVNGTVVVDGDNHTGNLPGKVLRKA
jgi:N-acyl-D-amino-acid deacylase